MIVHEGEEFDFLGFYIGKSMENGSDLSMFDKKVMIINKCNRK